MQSVVFYDAAGLAQTANFRVVTTHNLETGAPMVVTLEPAINHEGINMSADQWFLAAWYTLTRNVHAAVRGYNEWSESRIAEHVFGIFQMANDVDGNRRTAHEEGVRIRNLTSEHFADMYDRVIRQYLRNITPGGVEWSFWIDSGSLSIGGANGSEAKLGLYKISCQDVGEDVSCAAAAIIFWMIMKSDKPEYNRYKKHIIRPSVQIQWKLKAREFQLQMGWNKETSEAQVLEAVNVFTDYRIVIVNPVLITSIATSKNGIDYVEDYNFHKIIYIYLDRKTHHYCTISAVQHFVHHIRGDNLNVLWCHQCASWRCDEHRPLPKQKRKFSSM